MKTKLVLSPQRAMTLSKRAKSKKPKRSTLELIKPKPPKNIYAAGYPMMPTPNKNDLDFEDKKNIDECMLHIKNEFVNEFPYIHFI